MNTERVRTGADVVAAFAASPPVAALWLDCLVVPSHWHIGVAFCEDGSQVLRVDQTDEGLRAREGIEPRDRWWTFLSVSAPQRARLRVALQRFVRAARTPVAVPVPFDHLYLGGRFTEDGQYLAVEGERGLNCASFVLAVFESARLPLLDRASFVGRALSPELLSALAEGLSGDDLRRLEAQQDQIFVPTEVAGACLFTLPNVQRAEVERGARFFEAQAQARVR